jgi:hypothetical protein
MMSLASQRKLTSQAIEDLWQNTFFGRYWRAIGTFLGRGKAASIWVSAAVVMIVNFLLGVSTSALLGETRFTSIQMILTSLMWVTFTYFTLISFLGIHSRLLKFLRLRFVESIKTEQDIQDLHIWATQWLSPIIPQFFFYFVFACVVAALGFYAIYRTTHFAMGVILIYFVDFFHLGTGIYGLISFISFLLRLRNWRLMLYPDDPASSPILLQLAEQLRDYILEYSLLVTVFMILTVIAGGLNIITFIVFMIFNWIPILILFFSGHYAFSSLITRVKYEKMGELQSKIMKLSDLGKADTETTTQIMRLMDYHDRVKAAKNSLINSQAIVNLIGSLALPSLAILIQAWPYVQNLFK